MKTSGATLVAEWALIASVAALGFVLDYFRFQFLYFKWLVVLMIVVAAVLTLAMWRMERARARRE